MNKTDLIEIMAQAADIQKAAAGRALDGLINAVTSSLAKGEAVVLTGFGTFGVTERKSRIGRNPKTGEAINIPASKAPKFKAGKALKEEVNK
jgi:DNA-binding protein HU-beta